MSKLAIALLGSTMLYAAEGAATVATEDNTSFIAKITPSRLCNPHKGLVTNADGTPKADAVLMCEIFGTVRQLKNKKLNNDDIGIALVGDFEGVNAETGEVKRSGYCYLPAGIQDVLVAAIKAQGTGDEVREPISFGLALYIRSAKNPAGYEWDCKKILNEQAVDPLAGVRGQLKSQRKNVAQIAAPSAKAAKAS